MVTGAAFAQPSNIFEFTINRNPNQHTAPWGITYGPDGAYWFCEVNGNAIGRIETVSNTITEILLTNKNFIGILGTNSEPFDIVTGPDNNLWFTEINSNKIARLNVNSNYVEFQIQDTNCAPFVMVVGPNPTNAGAGSNLWFVEYNQNKIATFNPFSPNIPGTTNLNFREYGPFGTSTQFGTPGTNAELYGLTVGPDNNLWFTQASYGAIGVLNPATGFSKVVYLTNSNCQPLSITSGSDGALWFTEFNTNKIGRITTNFAVTEFVIPTNSLYPLPDPYGIVLGHDGNIWFTEFTGSAIGSITPTGVVTLFPTPTTDSTPTFLATGNPAFGNDTNIWFGEFPSNNFNDAIGKLVLGEALGMSAPASISIPTKTFSGTLATFQNSNTNNTVIVGWGDGTTNSLIITNSFATTNSIVVSNAVKFTNSLTITNSLPFVTNGPNGQFSISAVHTFASSLTNFGVILTVTDGSNDVATANIAILDAKVTTTERLTIKTSGTNLTLTWPGSGFNLQSAPSVRGPWGTIAGAVSPFTTPRTSLPQFFRLQSQ